MDELLDGLWRWTARHPEFHPQGFAEVACFALRDDLGTILVDPLLPEDDAAVLEALDGIVSGRVRIVVTVPYHVRSAEALWRRYRERPRDDDPRPRPLRHAGSRTRRASGRSPTGRSSTATSSRTASATRAGTSARCGCRRTARWRSATRSSTWTASCGCGTSRWTASRRRRWYEDRYLPTLEALLDHDVERVLVTHGEPVLQGGRKALEAAYAKPPWQRVKGGG